jgi:large subunit ribosomal protein L1
MKKTKLRQDAERRYDKDALYGPRDAVDLVKTMAYAKFPESVDVSFLLGIDARQADQLVRGTVSLPHGTGKSVRVAAFAESDAAREAEAAGADVIGGADLAEEIQGGRNLDFDVVIATPDMMPVVGKLGPILGPRGLMPNPKSGTVTADIGSAVAAFKAGRVEYRNDRYGNVHVPIGRVTFEADQLVENLAAVAIEIIRARPSSAKGRFMRKVGVSSTMGPGIRIDPSQIEDLAKEYR